MSEKSTEWAFLYRDCEVAENWVNKQSFYFYYCWGKLSVDQPIALQPTSWVLKLALGEMSNSAVILR